MADYIIFVQMICFAQPCCQLYKRRISSFGELSVLGRMADLD